MPEEINSILKHLGENERPIDIDFEIGETVKVNEGPFANFTGSVEEIDKDKAKVKVLVDMFGRDTPVELEFTQVEKI